MIKIKNVMFHEKKFYKSDEIDLLQLIKKPMTEIITYDVFMLFMILPIQKLDNDEKNEFLINFNSLKFIESINQEKSLKKSLVSIFFISDSISIFTFDQNVFVSKTSKNEIIIESFDQSTPDSFERRVKDALTSHDIASKIDESNILFQRIKRSKRKKQHYDDQLNRIASKIIDAFHLFFEAHFSFIQYYQVKSNQIKIIESSLTISFEKLHRDNMFFEFRYFQHLKTHPHAKKFEKIMKIELIALNSKKT